MRHVLCFGDSNTFDTAPLVAGGRHPDDMRWTGILQRQLGADWRVIEEGLGGRTAVYDDPIEPVPTKNGATALPINYIWNCRRIVHLVWLLPSILCSIMCRLIGLS